MTLDVQLLIKGRSQAVPVTGSTGSPRRSHQQDPLLWVVVLYQFDHRHDLVPLETPAVAVLAVEGDVGPVDEDVVRSIAVVPGR